MACVLQWSSIWLWPWCMRSCKEHVGPAVLGLGAAECSKRVWVFVKALQMQWEAVPVE